MIIILAKESKMKPILVWLENVLVWVTEGIAVARLDKKNDPTYFIEVPDFVKEQVKVAVKEAEKTLAVEIKKLNEKNVMEEGNDYALFIKKFIQAIEKEEYLREEVKALKKLQSEIKQKAVKQNGRLKIQD